MSLWLLFPLVFLATASLDFCHAQYVMAVEKLSYKAPLWSVAQWCCGLLGFLVALKVTLWVLPAEALGLATGSMLAIWRAKGTLTR